MNEGAVWERQSFVGESVLHEREISDCCTPPILTSEKCDDCKRVKGVLAVKRSASVSSEMETLVSKSSTGSSRALEADRHWGLPPSSIRNILHEVLNQYPSNYCLTMNFYHRIP
ncbi:hypothetical protein NPIL_446601 [Nephila pilipes]|uniref:Uncharacterized protein n=1 Tax=Nephila pilipes TaxID=299642 RepID=A0A8X6PCD6_NEPPI|nr:hypothetical protein NPIL_446601 [Nephila pilipes]